MGNSEGQRNIFWSCLKNILEKNGPRYWWTIWRPIWLWRWSELRQQMSSFHPPPPWSLLQKGKNFLVKGTYVSYVSKSVFGVTVVTWTSQCLIRFYHQHTYIFFLAILWGSYTFYFGNGSEAQWSRKVDSIISSPPLCFITAVYSPQSFNVWYQMLDLVC